MQALREEIAGLKVYPRTFARYPFDHIGLALVSKAFSISNALLALLEAGFADEAFGLTRSLKRVSDERLSGVVSMMFSSRSTLFESLPLAAASSLIHAYVHNGVHTHLQLGT